jgi:hypothetical protein
MRKLVLLALALTASACGTIMHGASQDLGITSAPSGAQIAIDNQSRGVTPMVANLSRKQNHIIHFTMDGYQAVDIAVTRSVSGWVWGNIVFGGVVGLAVDAISGGLYKLNSDQILATMPKGSATKVGKDGAYIAVVMRPDPSWQKVGQLNRIGQ